MTAENTELTFSDLPETVPVFPLPGVLLLPRALLPLNIFEPRYLNMVRDALETRERLIGMVQPADAHSELYEPPLFSVGCAGRIIESSDTPDGRMLITLRGVCRFELDAEIGNVKGYRRVRAGWRPYHNDFAAEEERIDRPRLVSALKRYFKRHSIEADWDALERTAAERLVSSIAMICPFDPSEKQALLEAGDLPQRTELMIALIEMGMLDQQGDASRH
jgi:Lon protease-like protein